MHISIFKRISGAMLTVVFFLVMSGSVFAQLESDSEEVLLYEKLGGLLPISIVVNDFVDVFIEDPLIMSNPAVRERKTEETAPYIKYQVITLVCQVTGGPCQYTGLDMKEAHDGLNVSEEEWDRMVELFVDTLEKHHVSDEHTQELLSIMGTTKEDIVVSVDN